MDSPKYKLVEPTNEEVIEFKKRFEDMLNDMSLYYEPVPQFSRSEIGKPWEVVCQVYLRKKVINDVPSPFSETKDEPTPTA